MTQSSPNRRSRIWPGIQRLLAAASDADAFLWLAAGGAGIALTVHALLYESDAVNWLPISQRLPLIVLFLILALISCRYPVLGPRYGQRVRLTPLVGLSATLLLPPPLASLPLILAVATLLGSQQDAATRRETLGSFLALIFAQITAALALGDYEHVTALAQGVQLTEYLMVGLRAIGFFGLLYLGGLFLAAFLPYGFRRRAALRRGQALPTEHDWSVVWVNEAWIYGIGAPFAVLLAFLLPSCKNVAVAAMLAGALGGVFVLLAHIIVDRRLLHRQLTALERLTQRAALTDSPDDERLLKEFLTHCRTLVLCDRAFVWLYSDRNLQLENMLEYPAPALRSGWMPSRRIACQLGEGLVGLVAKRRECYIVKDARREGRHPYYALDAGTKKALGPVSTLLVPLLDSGELLGVVELERRAWSAYSASDGERVRGLATLMAMSLSNSRLHQVILHQAVTDGLTGLFNKRHAVQILNDEVRRADRYGHPLSILMMDLDSFKSYNDTYGHVQGDLLLQQFSRLVREGIRAADTAGRFGGEEFFVIMPETEQEAALATAERIRATVEGTLFPGKRGAPPSVCKTVSIGVAAFPHHGRDPQALIAAADEALYAAKNGGRNRVMCAETVPLEVIEATSPDDGWLKRPA